GLPSDIHFVLGLHEGSVVGIATGYAVARGEPALVNLHTAPGLGNAINAIANARDMHVPLVVLVGQQDRRQLAYEPFLPGRALERLAGEYPVWSSLPVRPQDVPGAIARAYNEAVAARGPALVVVPMGDWAEPADDNAAGWPDRALRGATAGAPEIAELADMINRAASPALVVGRSDDCESWEAVTTLAERLRRPVWQESFARAAGFPQDHRQFAGHLPWRRRQIRDTLAPHDLVLTIGTHAFRLYILDDDGPMVGDATRVAVLTDDPDEAHRSPCALAVVAPVAAACAALAEEVDERDVEPRRCCAAPRRRHLPRPATRCCPAMSTPRWPSGCPGRRSVRLHRRPPNSLSRPTTGSSPSPLRCSAPSTAPKPPGRRPSSKQAPAWSPTRRCASSRS
ncbi:MAG TPA: thiamine pyrophosphate-binding protein, partial [Solirubrobacteraceae bacterium]|nr:thiamine pyrophosphate-binding protein [Solirubrobacteraceae bacterium]